MREPTIRIDLGGPPEGKQIEITCDCVDVKPIIMAGVRAPILYMLGCSKCHTRHGKILLDIGQALNP